MVTLVAGFVIAMVFAVQADRRAEVQQRAAFAARCTSLDGTLFDKGRCVLPNGAVLNYEGFGS